MAVESIKKVREAEEQAEDIVHDAADEADRVIADARLEATRRISAAGERATGENSTMRRRLEQETESEVQAIWRRARAERERIKGEGNIRMDSAIKAVLEMMGLQAKGP